MGKKVLADLDFVGGAKITGLPAAAADGQPVTYEQMNAAVEGTNWKDSVRVASTVNVTLSGPGTSIDGVTLTSGDRVLLKDQTSVPANGIYIFNGSAVPLTRANDASTFPELESAVVMVEEGTSAGSSFRQTQTNGTLDTDDVIWTGFGANTPAATESTAGKAEIATQSETNTGTDDQRFVTPAKLLGANFLMHKPFAQDFGDGSSTSFNIDHNLGTRDVQVSVYRNSGSYDEILCEVGHSTVNRVILSGFVTPPTSGQYRVVVSG